MIRRILCVACPLALLLATAVHADDTPPDRPNILWISAEDMSPNLGSYGDPHAHTPNLDALAAGGVRYNRAFTPTGVCATTRSSIIMGMYASSIGTQHMRSTATLAEETRPFPAYRRDAGYYTTNSGKTDYSFRWEPNHTSGQVCDHSDSGAHWRNRPDEDQPFFAVFNFNITHESRLRAGADIINDLPAELRTDPNTLDLPPFLVDTPAAREEWARYYDLIALLDYRDVPSILNQLEEEASRTTPSSSSGRTTASACRAPSSSSSKQACTFRSSSTSPISGNTWHPRSRGYRSTVSSASSTWAPPS